MIYFIINHSFALVVCPWLPLDFSFQTNVTNSQNHGAVEICAIKEFITLLRYLISLDLPNLPVWKNLLKMMSSDLEEEAEAAGKCLRTLTDRSEELGIRSVLQSQ